MEPFSREAVLDAIIGLLEEVCSGPQNPRETWVVSNETDSGILGTLSRISPEHASRAPRAGAPTIAGHVDHVRFALHAGRRWLTENTPPQINWKEIPAPPGAPRRIVSSTFEIPGKNLPIRLGLVQVSATDVAMINFGLATPDDFDRVLYQDKCDSMLQSIELLQPGSSTAPTPGFSQ